MGVYDVHETSTGVTIGFDDDRGEWVRVDKQAFEGSIPGNLARGAGRSVESLFQGAQDLLARHPAYPAEEREREFRESAELRQRQEAASAAAPVAEMFGGAIPDVAAGLGVGLATGGAGLPAMLGAEAGLGALFGGIRPGSLEERATGAVVSSALAVGGLALSPIAGAAIGSALKLFGGLENRVLGKVAQQVDTAGVQLRAADEAGSVGAARTPGELVDEGVRQESRLLETGEDVGADLMDIPRMQQMADRARDLDMPTPIGFGTRQGSPARLGQGAMELVPFGDEFNKRIMNTQKAKMSHYLSDALGVQRKDILLTDDLNDARREIGNKFDKVKTSMPAIDGAEIQRALESVGGGAPGLFGPMTGQKAVGKAIKGAEGRPMLSGEEFMNTRNGAAEQMADAFAKGHGDSGELIMAAINKMDEVAAKALKKAGDEKTAKLWETARTQWRVLKMTEGVALNAGTGEINPVALWRQLNKAPARGGWRGDRPEAGTPARKLYDSVEIGVASQSMDPATGKRLATLKALMQSGAVRTGAGVVGGGAAASGLGLWD